MGLFAVRMGYFRLEHSTFQNVSSPASPERTVYIGFAPPVLAHSTALCSVVAEVLSVSLTRLIAIKVCNFKFARIFCSLAKPRSHFVLFLSILVRIVCCFVGLESLYSWVCSTLATPSDVLFHFASTNHLDFGRVIDVISIPVQVFSLSLSTRKVGSRFISSLVTPQLRSSVSFLFLTLEFQSRFLYFVKFVH